MAPDLVPAAFHIRTLTLLQQHLPSPIHPRRGWLDFYRVQAHRLSLALRLILSLDLLDGTLHFSTLTFLNALRSPHSSDISIAMPTMKGCEQRMLLKWSADADPCSQTSSSA